MIFQVIFPFFEGISIAQIEVSKKSINLTYHQQIRTLKEICQIISQTLQ